MEGKTAGILYACCLGMVTSCRESKYRKRGWTRVEIDLNALPDDPEELKTLLRQTVNHLNALVDRGIALEERLELELARRYRRRSEKNQDPAQLRLFAGLYDSDATQRQDEDDSANEAEDDEPGRPEPSRRRKRKKKNGRRPLPDTLPRVRKVLDLDEDERRCRCCNEPMAEIGRETSEQLEYVPAKLFVLQIVRPKYACKHCQDGVVTVEPPAAPIAKGLAGPGLLAHIVTSKYCDHLPLHRQEAIFARLGVELGRSTMADWVARCADLLEPIYEAMKAEVLAGRKIHVDETPVSVQRASEKRRKKKKKKKKSNARHWELGRGYLWTYVGDAEHPFTVYDYTPSRSRAGPKRFLEGYRGYIQADDYQGYRDLYRGGNCVHAACWAHVRRKFYDARDSDRRRALHAIEMIRQLYAIERRIHDLPVAEKATVRQREAKPILEAFRTWLTEQQLCVLPKSLIGRAIGYALRLWPSLERYLEDGCLDIDNNAAERAIKPLVIGRKNWLFAGSDAAGRRGAIIFSTITSCKRHGVDPHAWLRDMFERLPRHGGEIRNLLPDRWQPCADLEAPNS